MSMRNFLFLMFLLLQCSLAWSMGEVPKQVIPEAAPTPSVVSENAVLEQTVNSPIEYEDQDTVFVIRKADVNIIPLWDMPGGREANANVVSGIVNNSKVKIIRRNAESTWYYIRSAEGLALEGWCESEFVQR